MNKKQMRAALKALALEIETRTRYERESEQLIQIPPRTINNWVRRLNDLSEDELLWT